LKHLLITEETCKKVADVLSHHWFSEDGFSNNSDIIEANRDLIFEMENQPEKEE
jgi:hypothetical protein